MRLVAVALCGLALGWGPAAEAGSGSLEAPAEPPMQVYLVRSAEPGCEPNCPEWIAAQGRIEAGALTRFKRVVDRLKGRNVPVLIDSGGGRVQEALAIGRLARARGLDIVVSRTALTGCAAADKECRRRQRREPQRPGLPDADMARCASACAFVLAGGTRRLVGPAAFVGVHRVRSFYVYIQVHRQYHFTPAGRQVVSERRVTERVIETPTPQRTYDQIRRYFADMGIGGDIMGLILATPGDRLHWLSPDELAATGLATDRSDGTRLLAGIAEPVSGDSGDVARPVEAATEPERASATGPDPDPTDAAAGERSGGASASSTSGEGPRAVPEPAEQAPGP
jgi:hypothetical protein